MKRSGTAEHIRNNCHWFFGMNIHAIPAVNAAPRDPPRVTRIMKLARFFVGKNSRSKTKSTANKAPFPKDTNDLKRRQIDFVNKELLIIDLLLKKVLKVFK